MKILVRPKLTSYIGHRANSGGGFEAEGYRMFEVDVNDKQRKYRVMGFRLVLVRKQYEGVHQVRAT